MFPRIHMSWFFPLAAAVAYGCTRVAVRIYRGEGRRPLQALLMLALGWYPFLIWCITQFMPDSSR